MPEYLSPRVYVEETDTGNKPIEGVSTSTAGAIGMTERGPVNVPILITSIGEYTRWFGQWLRREEFSNALGAHCYLPHAIDGFFTNGGKRVYVTRVLDTNAAAKAEGVREAVERIDVLLRKYSTEIHAGRVYRTNVLYDLRHAKRAILDEEAAR